MRWILILCHEIIKACGLNVICQEHINIKPFWQTTGLLKSKENILYLTADGLTGLTKRMGMKLLFLHTNSNACCFPINKPFKGQDFFMPPMVMFDVSTGKKTCFAKRKQKIQFCHLLRALHMLLEDKAQ